MTEAPAAFADVLALASPLAARFAAEGHRLYLVGGIVRDGLLGRSRDEGDLDATTAARPPEIKRIVSGLADAVWSQGERFGTIGCTIGGQAFEITTHRAESYDEDSRKPTVSFGDDITADLARRDFTVNAMAVDVGTGELIDPHGGRVDLDHRVLRTPLDPEIAFSEDPLRMLRAARFHAGYGLVPTPELESAITALVDRMAIVSVERIRDEMEKLLLLDEPGPGLAMLVRTGLMARIVEEGDPLDEAAARRLGARLGAVPASPPARWAVFFDGFGREPGISPVAWRRLRFSRRLADAVNALSTRLPVADTGARIHPSAASVRNEVRHIVGTDLTFDDVYDTVEGLRRLDGLPTDDLDELRATHAALRASEPDLDDPQPALDGVEVGELLGIDPGPAIGRALDFLREIRWREGIVPKAEAADRLAAWWPTRDD
ncbi:MAG: CCA tRNA nucleotidyltransferase [Acidimicrobiales bacterium]|nr:CCA tRNA nucleotidyltransferase [Acidimicrobiales bacterium]